MANVNINVAAQLQQWSFGKQPNAARSERSSSDSSTSSPILCDVRIDSVVTPSSPPRKESIVLQDRYMSSEEALSPVDDASDSEYDYDDVVINDPAKARTMSISRWDKGKSCDMAVMVSYAFVGRPKVVELDCRSPITDLPPQHRSASLANLPVSAIAQLRKEAAQRLSMRAPPAVQLSSPNSRTTTPSVQLESRRPSTSHSPVTKNFSTFNLSDATSTTSSSRTASSMRSISPAVDELLARPSLAPSDMSSSARSSVYVPSHSRLALSRTQTTQSQWAPSTPSSPATHAFLSSDPYETSTTHSASPIIKSGPHKRLRSISMKLALAKIAIGPSKKTYDARNGKVPGTPSTPYTPLTPMTAPLEGSSSFISPQKLRRASTILRPKSRHGDSVRGPSPEFAPPVPVMNTGSAAVKRMSSRMQPRGANEREPMLVIPPCPSDDDDPMSSFRSKTLKKRKSLMSLMESL